MKTFEMLEEALALIEDVKDWYQGGFNGPNGERCAGQALLCQPGQPIMAALFALEAAMPSREPLGWFNDTHTHAEVVALFQKAIRQEKVKEASGINPEEFDHAYAQMEAEARA